MKVLTSARLQWTLMFAIAMLCFNECKAPASGLPDGYQEMEISPKDKAVMELYERQFFKLTLDQQVDTIIKYTSQANTATFLSQLNDVRIALTKRNPSDKARISEDVQRILWWRYATAKFAAFQNDFGKK